MNTTALNTITLICLPTGEASYFVAPSGNLNGLSILFVITSQPKFANDLEAVVYRRHVVYVLITNRKTGDNLPAGKQTSGQRRHLAAMPTTPQLTWFQNQEFNGRTVRDGQKLSSEK